MIDRVDTEALQKVHSIVVRLIECSEEALKSIPPDKGGRNAKLSSNILSGEISYVFCDGGEEREFLRNPPPDLSLLDSRHYLC